MECTWGRQSLQPPLLRLALLLALALALLAPHPATAATATAAGSGQDAGMWRACSGHGTPILAFWLLIQSPAAHPAPRRAVSLLLDLRVALHDAVLFGSEADEPNMQVSYVC